MKMPVAVLLFVLPTFLSASSTEVAPKMAATPLSLEQIAVYRAFLNGFDDGSHQVLNLADITGPLEPDEGDYAGCMKRFPHEAKAMEVHRLPPSLEQAGAIRLVDPTKHRIMDPEDAMKNGVPVDKAVEQGFAGGVLSLSEIIFDVKHQHAALNYSFHCGRLCGHGATLIFDLNAGKWSESRQSCGSWIS